MTILSTIKRIGIIPTLYKLKHLYVTPDSNIISQSSQNGAYEYLKRYKYAVNPHRKIEELPLIKDTNYIWVCWLQGIDNAPLLVKRCIESIKRHNTNREVILLTEENISQYVAMPEIIRNKHKIGNIPFAHYSDILRLMLLNQYGGIWIDSTIFMTGTIPEYIDGTSFFMFHSSSEQGHVCCANGFIASCAHHPIIEHMLSLLLEYWKKENKLISYSIFHLFFYMLTHELDETAKSIWEDLPVYYYIECDKLRNKLDKNFNNASWEQIQQCSPIHKLTYKFDEYHIDTTKKGTFYDVLINQNTPTC